MIVRPRRLAGIAVMTAALWAAAIPAARGQMFINLDFEDAMPPPWECGPNGAEPCYPPWWASWEEGAPGWGHSDGDDTDHLFYWSPHLGISQFYWLRDTEWNGPPLQGRFSLTFASGYASSMDEPGDSEWVQAFISQSGVIPKNARYVQFLGRGPLSVHLLHTPLPLIDRGGNRFAADLFGFFDAFPFHGSFPDWWDGGWPEFPFPITFRNDAEESDFDAGWDKLTVTIDAIRFTAGIPEPGRAMLGAVSLLFLLARRDLIRRPRGGIRPARRRPPTRG